MAALTGGRKTPRFIGDERFNYPQKGATTIFAGGIVMVDSSGYARPGATATGMIGAGRACTRGGLDRYDNSAGADGAIKVDVEEGIFQYANSAAADQIGQSELGKVCYIVDDQTVAKTDGGGTRSKAGIVRAVDNGGVFVEMRLGLTRQATV
jgi:hypothetical protein